MKGHQGRLPRFRPGLAGYLGIGYLVLLVALCVPVNCHLDSFSAWAVPLRHSASRAVNGMDGAPMALPSGGGGAPHMALADHNISAGAGTVHGDAAPGSSIGVSSGSAPVVLSRFMGGLSEGTSTYVPIRADAIDPPPRSIHSL